MEVSVIVKGLSVRRIVCEKVVVIVKGLSEKGG